MQRRGAALASRRRRGRRRSALPPRPGLSSRRGCGRRSGRCCCCPRRSRSVTGPVFGECAVGELDADLTRQHAGEPARPADRRLRAGARRGRPAGARRARSRSGRRTPRAATATTSTATTAPLDPNFDGAGRCLTDAEGRYRFVDDQARAPTPGATTRTPGGRRTSTSRCSGVRSRSGSSTQMYFPGDPLFPFDPIFGSVRDPKARERLISRFDLGDDDARVGARVPLRHRPAAARGRRRSRA